MKIEMSSIKEVLSKEQLAILEANKDKFKEHQCVANSRLVSQLLGFDCVEGVILIALDDSHSMRYCRHCWNVMSNNELFIDVTAEYCFRKQPDVIRYIAVALCNENDYISLQAENPQKVFCSNAVLEALRLNYDMYRDELNSLEHKILEKGKEYSEMTDDLMHETNSIERDKKILELNEKHQTCKESFLKYKEKLKEIIDDLMENLSNEEKQLLKTLADDILSDTTNDNSKSRLEKLEELKDLVLQYLK